MSTTRTIRPIFNGIFTATPAKDTPLVLIVTGCEKENSLGLVVDTGDDYIAIRPNSIPHPGSFATAEEAAEALARAAGLIWQPWYPPQA